MQGRQHVDKLAKGFKYNSFPPTSGKHNPQPAIWNLYTQPVRSYTQVHNLEHGGIIVQYGDQVPAATVQEISDVVRAGPDGAPRGAASGAEGQGRVHVLDAPAYVPGLRRRAASTRSGRYPSKARKVPGRTVTTGLAQYACPPGWRNGRRGGLKILCPSGRAGSTPTPGMAY